MRNIVLKGLIAGLLAGLVLATLFFVDYGPGGLLHDPARWLALDSKDAGKFVGFVLFIVLGGAFGVLYGIIQGRRETTLGGSLLLGTAMGALFWVIVPLLSGVIINHWQFNLGDFLISFVPLLLYGLLLGSFFFQMIPRGQRTLHA